MVKYNDGPDATYNYIRDNILIHHEGEDLKGIVIFRSDPDDADGELVSAHLLVSGEGLVFPDEHPWATLLRLVAEAGGKCAVLWFSQHGNDDLQPCAGDLGVVQINDALGKMHGIPQLNYLMVNKDDYLIVSIRTMVMGNDAPGLSAGDRLRAKAREGQALTERLRRMPQRATDPDVDDLIKIMEVLNAFMERGEQPPAEMLERALHLGEALLARYGTEDEEPQEKPVTPNIFDLPPIEDTSPYRIKYLN